MNPIDPHAIVSTLLAAAGLSPDPDEIDAAAEGYPSLRASLDRMHDLLPDHEEEPELKFWASRDGEASGQSASGRLVGVNASTLATTSAS